MRNWIDSAQNTAETSRTQTSCFLLLYRMRRYLYLTVWLLNSSADSDLERWWLIVLTTNHTCIVWMTVNIFILKSDRDTSSYWKALALIVLLLHEILNFKVN